MTQAKPRFSTFEEYLSYTDGTDKLYEFRSGELIELPPESGLNVELATFLLIRFALLVGHSRVRGHGLELEVRGEPRNRFPDLTILREEHIAQLKRRNTIRLEMAPPLLVVEMVSPGDSNRERDYVEKRSQYSDRCIPEYWIVDAAQQAVTVLALEQAAYNVIGVFSGDQRIVSLIFPELELTPEEIFEAA